MVNLTCIALNCTSSSRNNKDLKFHHIPCDPERSKHWLTACKRTDLINQSPRYLKNKFVCSLHFNKSMYRNENLKYSALPLVISVFRDSFTQTWESVKFIEPSEPTLLKTELSELKKIEVTTSFTQTEEFIFNANCNLEVKKENDNTDTQFDEHNMQCNELEVKTETKIEEDDEEEDTELSDENTEEMEQTSTDSKEESEDETSEMSIDEFLQLNEGLAEQLRKELNKKEIPQTPIQNATYSREIHKGVQTDDVAVFDIPKNNKCFQQCLRCGKNKNRLKPLLKPDHRITLEEFETACERFLSPTFCATVKTQIKLDKLLDKNTDDETKKKIMSFFGVSLSN